MSVLRVDPLNPQAVPIAEAARLLRAGRLVAFPTETVYGLGASALDADAVERIYQAKGRPHRNPIIVHVAGASAARELVAAWPGEAEALAQAFWPGPLTLVLPRADMVPDIVTAGGPTVGIRVPAHPVALALLRAVDLPLAAPSANPSNRLSPTRAEHVAAGLGDRVDLILDAGQCPGGLESTVLDLSAGPPRILRPGLLSAVDLERMIGKVELPRRDQEAGAALASPGLLDRHYAPRTPLHLVEPTADRRVAESLEKGLSVGWITFRDAAAAPGLVVRTMPADPAGYASWLYAVLHEMDQLGLQCIVVDLPPQSEAWRAIHDRLRRAAAALV